MKRALFEQVVMATRRNPLAALKLLRHLPSLARLYWRAFWDRRTGAGARLALLATVLYVLSPVDLLPVLTFGPVGLLDDLSVFLFGCQAFLRLVPDDVLRDHLQGSAGDAPVG